MTSKKKIVVLPGDYIGPEIMAAGLAVLAAATQGTDFKYELIECRFGGAGIDQVGQPLPEETIRTAQQADAILLSAIGGPKWDQAPIRPEAGLLSIRSALNLFANIRPTQVSSAQIERSPLKAENITGTDFVIVRELTSGAYFGKPRRLDHDEAVDTMYYSRTEIERVMSVGFQMAQKRKQHVTVVDKSNVLATSKLWRQIGKEFSERYPDVQVDYRYVDAMSMAIIAQPAQFDVVITPNLFGDILSDEAAQITGSIGQIQSMSIGANGPNLYEPIHGSAPDIAGKGIANPLSMVNTVAMMMTQSFNENQITTKIQAAVDYVIAHKIVTPDMGGDQTTASVTKALVDFIREEN
ncbi:3-isopropylmalate dehydrogenase [Convivina praedatoris]|uniref:3-isopropylmalate dehydrogenase n=1 Tax=Convivina praedatoris TaxID=2880963 RepID=A0ABM9D1V1_9LACO|nr:3-isopropylmalate dehydrogenase [Convivina sp. LMG 32447]CAH1850276.1 3-isopropylmalate dehydrogenase [Convivina sp. LMG 32447]CAH1850915.1 3-isopropylmalate dehydrogenase [Convivina sp. LMG 32447]CAH1850928.1 3-isopropylmalate dehydrogenase [Convivina sp. LMG 32447]